eukprot:1748529-Pyramimonas_sp.AAC.1
MEQVLQEERKRQLEQYEERKTKRQNKEKTSHPAEKEDKGPGEPTAYTTLAKGRKERLDLVLPK